MKARPVTWLGISALRNDSHALQDLVRGDRMLPRFMAAVQEPTRYVASPLWSRVAVGELERAHRFHRQPIDNATRCARRNKILCTSDPRDSIRRFGRLSAVMLATGETGLQRSCGYGTLAQLSLLGQEAR